MERRPTRPVATQRPQERNGPSASRASHGSGHRRSGVGSRRSPHRGHAAVGGRATVAPQRARG
eukprot:15436194-Alexandrium_andersonii.AAC.1